MDASDRLDRQFHDPAIPGWPQPVGVFETKAGPSNRWRGEAPDGGSYVLLLESFSP
jgi:hypothetical protein